MYTDKLFSQKSDASIVFPGRQRKVLKKIFVSSEKDLDFGIYQIILPNSFGNGIVKNLRKCKCL